MWSSRVCLGQLAVSRREGDLIHCLDELFTRLEKVRPSRYDAQGHIETASDVLGLVQRDEGVVV
jgi:hypothetical protein